ncbi:MAG TPA: helix-turn-helix domain-containing protein [Candidatus Dormibacteraeota bacterium]|nr:helix-turn-helix domain-containing protein [Candidatus Dormibacteraeota bacterium]
MRVEDDVRVAGLPAGARTLDLWYPLVTDDANQQVLDMSIDLGHPLDLGHDPEHGNRMVHLRLLRPLPERVSFRVSYLVSRTAGPTPEAAGRSAGVALMLRELEVGSAAAPLRRAAAGASRVRDPLERAARLRAPAGVLPPDELEAVERFVATCRLAGVPARLVAGLRAGAGGVVASHPWAELFAADRGWVPADPLCAPDGGPAELCALGPDHVGRSRGQHVLLQPAQRGPRLRVFNGPYAEVDGRPHPVQTATRMRLEASEPAAAGPPGARVPDLGPMLAEELGMLEPAPHTLRLARGALLPVAGDHWLYVLTGGRLRLSRLTIAGRRLELAVLAAPAFFQADRVRRGVAEALTDCELRPLSRDEVLRLARRRPDFGFRLLETFGQRLVESEDRLEYLACHAVPARLALALLRLQDRNGAVEEVTHQQLGDVVGASRETVTKVLGHFQAEGTIRVRHRRIEILDPATLAEQLTG